MSGDGSVRADAAPSRGGEGSIGSNASSGPRRLRLLYTPEDDEHLSDLMCLTRQQIEVFAATPEDIDARARRGGASQTFEVGRVGLRCVHCADLPTSERRARGAVHYPASVRIVHQAVRNWQRYHFLSCERIPEEAKEKYRRWAKQKSKHTCADYWIESCARLGMVDAKDGTGIFFVGSENETDEGACADACAGDDYDNTGDGPGVVGSSADAEIITKSDRSDSALGDASAEEAEFNSQPLANAGTGTDVRLSDRDLDIVIGPALHPGDANIAADLNIREKHRESDARNDEELANNSLQHSQFSKPVLQSMITQLDDANIAANVDSSDFEHIKEKLKGIHVNSVANTSFGEPLEPNGGMVQSQTFQLGVNKEHILEQVCRAHELVKASLEIRLAPQSDVSGAMECTQNEQGELFSLGIDMYKLFANGESFQNGNNITTAKVDAMFECLQTTDTPQKKREKTSVAGGAFVPLREHGYPIPLCNLVSNLLGENSHDHCLTAIDRYRTLDEVQEDLRLMIADPERYLFDAGADRLSGQLDFTTGKLFGRELDISRLVGVFDRVAGSNSPSEMVLISGYSGTGKSVLVDQLRRPLVERNGHFISGKFDKLGQVQPMMVIFAAFNDFCGNLLQGDEGRLVQTRLAIDKALGPNVNVLTGLIPDLSSVMGVTDPSLFDIGGKEALNRFLLHFRLFVRAIASPSHPVVFFLDDLQWADASALDLLTTLVLDRETRSLLFVGCFRDNEVGPSHPLNVAVANITVEAVTITSIKLANIDRESVNGLISDTLRLSPRLSRSLANAVYAKTSGNPFFAVQFLRSLYDAHLLRFSASSRRWEWDVETIESMDIADDVVNLVKQKMIGLAPPAQKLLTEAACLGSRFEASTLKLLSSDGDNDGSRDELILGLAVDEGFMCRIGSSYKFSHDQIQQAAYSLIPSIEQKALHLSIGRRLRRRASEEELMNIIFIVVDQLHRGSGLLTDHAEKVDVARICLMAGEVAMRASAFVQASLYLLQGTALLDESDWLHHYRLSLELFSCCATSQYVTGNYDGALITLGPIMKHGLSIQDKLRAYLTRITCLGSQSHFREAVDFGLQCLAQLGESFPREINQSDIMENFAKTRAMLGGMTVDDILQKNTLEDARIVSAMKLLTIVSISAHQVDQKLMSLVIFRMVQVSLCHGVSAESSLGFATFGAMLCNFGDLAQGYQYGKLALSLLDRFNSKECLARVYFAMYHLIAIFTEPLQAILPKLKDGYETGMAHGDIKWGLTTATAYILTALQCGSKLDRLADEARAYMHIMKQHNHSEFLTIQPYVQTILNLMGCSGDPVVLTGEAMNQEELLKNAREKGHQHAANRVNYCLMWLAYLFRRYDVAVEMVKQRQEIIKARPVRPEIVVTETFYTGLIAAVMARKEAQGDWKNIAVDAAEKMKVWTASSSWNFQHKFDLLRAEIAHVNNDSAGAAKAYGDAIRVAGEHRFIHEQALACERAGMFFLETIGTKVAAEYFERAQEYYLEWGAKQKAQDLSEQLSENCPH